MLSANINIYMFCRFRCLSISIHSQSPSMWKAYKDWKLCSHTVAQLHKHYQSPDSHTAKHLRDSYAHKSQCDVPLNPCLHLREHFSAALCHTQCSCLVANAFGDMLPNESKDKFDMISRYFFFGKMYWNLCNEAMYGQIKRALHKASSVAKPMPKAKGLGLTVAVGT